MPGTVFQIDNKNWIQFVQLQGILLDKQIVLEKPCRLISAVLCGGGGGPAMLTAAWFSFQKLGLEQAGLGALPINLPAIPISHFQRAVNIGTDIAGDPNWPVSVAQIMPQHPKIRFKCPFSSFYINMWGIDSSGAVSDQVTMTLICSDDIEEIVTYPTPKIFV